MKTYKHPTLWVAQLPWRMTILSWPLRLTTEILCDKEEDLLALWFVEVEEKKLPMSREEVDKHEFNLDKIRSNIRPSQELKDASLAIHQLIRLRDIWREWWTIQPDKIRYCVSLFLSDRAGEEDIDEETWMTYRPTPKVDFQCLYFETVEKRDLFQKTFANLIQQSLPLFYS